MFIIPLVSPTRHVGGLAQWQSARLSYPTCWMSAGRGPMTRTRERLHGYPPHITVTAIYYHARKSATHECRSVHGPRGKREAPGSIPGPSIFFFGDIRMSTSCTEQYNISGESQSRKIYNACYLFVCLGYLVFLHMYVFVRYNI